jgi:hypothetical protein
VGAARIGKGPSLFLTETLRNLILDHWIQLGALSRTSFAPPSSSALALELPRGLLQAGYALATGFELLAPFAMVSRRFRFAFVAFAAAFHTSTAVAMGVPFVENFLLLVVFSATWFHIVAGRLEETLGRQRVPAGEKAIDMKPLVASPDGSRQ